MRSNLGKHTESPYNSTNQKKKHPLRINHHPFFYHQKKQGIEKQWIKRTNKTNNKAQMIQMPFQPHPLHPLLPHQGRHNLLSLKRRPSLTNLSKARLNGHVVTRGRWGRCPPTNQAKLILDEQVLNPQTPKND